MTAMIFDTHAGAAFLDELEASISVLELEAILEVDDTHDVDLTEEQLALAGIVAELADPRTFHQQAAAIAQRLRLAPDAGALAPVAHACVNRLLSSPFALLWQGHGDGGIALKREARVLRARLYRACSG